MKSIEMTQETYLGIPADAEAFTLEDENRWFESQDIACMPAVLATLKGLRAAVAPTALAVKTAGGESVAAGTELSLAAAASLRVRVDYTPVYSHYPITWSSGDSTKVKVTAEADSCYALIEPVAANTSAITITATGPTGVTGTCTIKPVA